MNQKPERIVQNDCLAWMARQGWHVQILESKATYSPKLKRYRKNLNVKEGTVDCIGTMPDGRFVAVEFKAPGKLSTLRPLQKAYLLTKIEHNAFACVVDSWHLLAKIYSIWDGFRVDRWGILHNHGKGYLFELLTKKSPA